MRINCETAVMGGPGQVAVPPCGKPAVMLIVILLEYNGWNDTKLGAVGYCEQHAAEEAHEARSSMSEDEFVVVNLTAETRLEKVRKYADGMRGSFINYNRIMANDVLDIINGDEPALDLEQGCGS